MGLSQWNRNKLFQEIDVLDKLILHIFTLTSRKKKKKNSAK